jgi:hypothetical protein
MLNLGKYVRLHNSGGNIDLKVPAVNMDLKLTGSRVSSGPLKNFDGQIDDDEISGKLNGGGTPVSVRANSGRVNFSMQ